MSLASECESSAARGALQRSGTGRMKHLEIRALAIQDFRQAGRLLVVKVPTEDNPADILTKAMAVARLARLGAAVGLVGGPFGRVHE